MLASLSSSCYGRASNVLLSTGCVAMFYLSKVPGDVLHGMCSMAMDGGG